jgi:hypothetical protein
MMQSFCSLNKLAALNLVNKYELVATRLDSVPHIVSSVTAMVNRCTFPHGSEEMTEMEQSVNEVFMEVFFPNRRGDNETDVQQLIGPVKLKRKYQRAMFLIGSCLGCIIAMAVLIIYLIAITPNAQALPGWGSTYLIFRMSVLVLLMVWYSGINMYAWKKALINFRFIAEVGRNRISHHMLHMFVAPISVITCFLFCLYLLCARGDIQVRQAKTNYFTST